MEREARPENEGRRWARRVPAVFAWLFIAGAALGLAVGLVLPRLLPRGSPRSRLPTLAWSGGEVLEVRPGRAREGLPAALAATVADLAAVDPSEAAGSSDVATASTKSTFDVHAELGTLPMDSEEQFVSFMERSFGEDPQYLAQRWGLSRKFIESHELQGAAIEAFLRTPREHFVREENLDRAYDDTWMPIGWGATITDPDVVSMMTTTLDVRPDDKVLEIGTGSGYQSAILSHLSNHVYTIEIIEPLYRETDALYRSLEDRYPSYTNISRKLGDGFYGWEKYAPFDRIIVTCAIDHLPPPLMQQLAPDGIMVVPLGPPARQYIMKVERTEENGVEKYARTDVYNGVGVQFIPFRDDSGRSYSGAGR